MDRSPRTANRSLRSSRPPDRRRFFEGLLVLAFWLLIWQALYLLVQKDLLLASPLQVARRLGQLALDPGFWKSVLLSLLRIQAGYLAGLLIGTLLAVATVRFSWVDKLLHPLISAIRSTPIASFIILALVWMSRDRVVIFIVVLMVLPIVWGNVTEGIQKTDRQLLQMAHVFKLSPRDVLRVIYVPSVAPFLTAAATTSLGLSWKAGIAAEVLSRPVHSLGGDLYLAKIYLETADLLATTLVVVVLSLLLERFLKSFLTRTGRWLHKTASTRLQAGEGP